jgi:hypothetical protein
VRVVNLHIAKLTLFNLLSGADLLLTWRLIRRGEGLVYECNPIASAWLSCFGWAGLVAFKIAMVGTIGFLAILISFYRPKVSGRILLFGCVVTAAVVLYSCYLSHWIGVEFAGLADEDTGLLEDQEFANRLKKREIYREFMAHLRGRLIDGRSSLNQAVDELERFGEIPNPAWLRIYQQRCPGLSRREYLAQHLLYHTIAELNVEPAQAARLALQVENQYHAAFGKPFPFPLLKVPTRTVQVAAKKE